MKTRLLRRVAKHIAEEPKRFLMDNWMEQGIPKKDKFSDMDAPFVKAQSFAECGTAACIGGWACLLADGRKVPNDFHVRAKEVLGLGEFEACSLFSVGNWPEKFAGAYETAKTQRQKVKAAVARIEHFIKTKGAE